ncbi:MAG: ribosome biogenesis GTPase Der [Proteobacteria bacterium]|nr:ribosome biogenesis GTPase Der [Pseudomonadota bacterium]NBS05797.1 ribosome biogenesis GTPase Der [Verrucomicrobiota bacterium]NBS78218.1 ribosome biogenesis GTPase Der [bacterium]
MANPPSFKSTRPVVAIVGRPNVGKSAIFNRICRRRIALVFDRPGVTRDRLVADADWEGRPFVLIDTGGLGLEDGAGLQEAVEREADLAISSADRVLLVVDGKEGLHVLDTEVAKRLRRAGRKVTLVVNKMDPGYDRGVLTEFQKLGFGDGFRVSAEHGLGFGDLMGEITQLWPEADRQKDERTRIAVVGRPNAGKSSLVNAWAGTDRTMVAAIAGTTRDAVDVPAEINGEEVLFIDTAGLRQKRRVEDPLEKIMGGRTAHAIDRCHLAILAVDSVLGVGLVEKKIAGLVQKAQRPCIVAITKWDLASQGGRQTQGASFRKEYETALRKALFFLPDAPMVFLSSVKKSGFDQLSEAVTDMRKARSIKIGTGELNRILSRATESRSTPVQGGKKLRIYYATQVEGPLPTLVGFVNHPGVMTEAYERFLSNRVREHFQLGGCPLRWRWRGRDKKSAG